MDSAAVAEILRGPKGTQVRVSVKRQGASEPVTAVVTRGEIETSVVDAFWVKPGTVYLGVTSFEAQNVAKAAQHVPLRGLPAEYIELSFFFIALQQQAQRRNERRVVKPFAPSPPQGRRHQIVRVEVRLRQPERARNAINDAKEMFWCPALAHKLRSRRLWERGCGGHNQIYYA